jgi:hypothetical protein
MAESENVPKGPRTSGEYVVGIPDELTGDAEADEILHKAAELIDLIDKLRYNKRPTSAMQSTEISRLKHRAMDAIEEAAAWAVKAALKPPGRPGPVPL